MAGRIAVILEGSLVDAHVLDAAHEAEAGKDEGRIEFRSEATFHPAVEVDRIGHADRRAIGLEEGQAKAAREKFLQALSLAPYSAEAHNNLALAEEFLGNLDAAQSHFRAALRLRPHNPRYLYNLGNYLNAQGDHREAFWLLKEAVR
jgi:tetratricopeptide (TPR) repeat protein